MKRDIKLSAFYPFPRERVWRALTDSESLSTWLMPNDFEPRVGHKFNFTTKPAPGFDGLVHCEVLELDEPKRLAYSWRGGPIDTVLSFDLEAVKNGTNLTLQHNGFDGIKALMVSMIMAKGWKKMFRTTLPSAIERISATSKKPWPTSVESKRRRF